ncbi:hypothetical protein MKW92_038667 [Papaver armeniacum]|nr:hypothetical protein MKW92_038667 [Papaver armeniacum]
MLIQKVRMISTTMLLLRHVDVIKKVMYEEWEEVLPRPRCVLRHLVERLFVKYNKKTEVCGLISIYSKYKLGHSCKYAPVESNSPAAKNRFIKNFRGRTIALGTYNNAATPMEHAYSVCVEEIFDRGAELYDEDGTLGDIMLGQVINWPKGSVQPYR